MTRNVIRTSAPGSIMITGEHAVVYGHKAIVAAIEQRVQVTLTPLSDDRVTITSEIAAPFEGKLSNLPSDGPYRFVLAALIGNSANMPGGCHIDIRSDIDPTLGLGSSAAVTIAVLGAVFAFCGKDKTGLHRAALAIVRNLQGRGSGADLAASLHGGVVEYTQPATQGDGAQITAFPAFPIPLGLRYCGYKTPTAEVLSIVAKRMETDPAGYAALYDQMGASVQNAVVAGRSQDWTAFYDSLNQYQIFMEQLGVSDETLAKIISDARRHAKVHVAKISGSGLGDCVLALGDMPDGFNRVTLAQTGLTIDD